MSSTGLAMGVVAVVWFGTVMLRLQDRVEAFERRIEVLEAQAAVLDRKVRAHE